MICGYYFQQKVVERHYMVKVDDDIEYVKLKDSLVEFLLRLNTQNREDTASDKLFIKGLIIAVFSVQKIKEKQVLHPNLVEFIKGM